MKKILKNDINLKATLLSGQAFRIKEEIHAYRNMVSIHFQKQNNSNRNLLKIVLINMVVKVQIR